MKVRVVLVGKTKHKFVQPAEGEYRKRLKRYTSLDERVLSEGKGSIDQVREQEAAAILRTIEGCDRFILLDERGSEFTSTQLAQEWRQMQDLGLGSVAVVVGGAYGVSEALREQADLVLALSRLTFPHQFVRAILYEQLYRIHTILKNEPYHH